MAVSKVDYFLDSLMLFENIGKGRRFERLSGWKLRAREREYGQARIGLWRMPGSCPAKKAAVSCEKLRGGANILRSADSRMG